MRPCVVVMMVALAACASTKDQRPSAANAVNNPTSDDPAAAPPVPAGAFVVTVDAGSEDEGRRQAKEAVRRQYFADAPALAVVEAALFAHTHVDVVGAGGRGVAVRAWVDNQAVRSVAEQALADRPPAVGPALPLRTVQDVARAVTVLDSSRERDAWCLLRLRAEGATCDPDESAARMREALAEAARSVQLRQMPSDGTPYKPGQTAYRPLSVVAMHGPPDAPQPWVGLPLRVQAPADRVGNVAGATDPRGQWQVPWRGVAQPGDVITVQVDAEALLGAAHAGLWAGAPVAIRMRPLTFKTVRLLLAIKSGTHPRDPLVDAARAQVLEALARLLPGATLASTAALVNKTKLEETAAAGHDVVANADLTWAFASALGGRSVWYEARAHVEALNSWSAETVLAADPNVQEAGIGDKHAAKQAVHKLAAELARHIAEAVRSHFPAL